MRLRTRQKDRAVRATLTLQSTEDVSWGQAERRAQNPYFSILEIRRWILKPWIAKKKKFVIHVTSLGICYSLSIWIVRVSHFWEAIQKGLNNFCLSFSLNHLMWIAQHIQMPLYVEYQWLAYYRCAYIDLWPCLEAAAWMSVCVRFPKIGVLVHSLVKNRGPSMCVYKNAFDFMGAWLPTTGHLL